MTTREQQRMRATWDRLTRRLGDNPDTWPSNKEAKAYLTAAKKTPIRIYNSGLGQALAFLRSRGGSTAASKNLERDLSDVTLEILVGINGRKDLIGSIRENDASFLFAATDEAVALCGWFSRYLSGAGVKSEDEESVKDQRDSEPPTDLPLEGVMP